MLLCKCEWIPVPRTWDVVCGGLSMCAQKELEAPAFKAGVCPCFVINSRRIQHKCIDIDVLCTQIAIFLMLTITWQKKEEVQSTSTKKKYTKCIEKIINIAHGYSKILHPRSFMTLQENCSGVDPCLPGMVDE